VAPEDPTEETGFKTEKAKTTFKAGKILMEWKTKEVAPSGQAREDYQRQLQSVKEGVSEAILNEQVPPGYHESIREYFDSIQAPAEGGAGSE
jgi:hypothetical protein